MYDETAISKLVDRSTQLGENARFSEAMTEVFKKFQWAKGTIYTVTATLRKILKETAACEHFVASIKRILPKKKLHPILGNTYTQLRDDDPARALLDQWILVLKTNTRNRSELGLRNIITFYLTTLLPQLGLSLNVWPDDIGKLIATKLSSPDTVRKLCGTSANASRKLQWLRIFCLHIAPCEVDLKTDWIEGCPSGREHMFDDGSDHHRISVHDLEHIYVEAKKVPKHNLMYMILITTGMRVGGLAQIKTEHVAVIMSNDVEVKQTGRTIEKGRKWVTFVMNERLARLDWKICAHPMAACWKVPPQRPVLGHYRRRV